MWRQWLKTHTSQRKIKVQKFKQKKERNDGQYLKW